MGEKHNRNRRKTESSGQPALRTFQRRTEPKMQLLKWECLKSASGLCNKRVGIFLVFMYCCPWLGSETGVWLCQTQMGQHPPSGVLEPQSVPLAETAAQCRSMQQMHHLLRLSLSIFPTPTSHLLQVLVTAVNFLATLREHQVGFGNRF